MIFSAKNATFYNYCQLLVTGNAHMYDGEFNLMNNSYTEATTAEFDNFIVNMDSNSGINIIGATDWKAQGDGTYQGFRVFDGASGSYVRLGGKATIASHKKTLSISEGITYYIKEIEIRKGDKVVTEQELKDNSDGDYPVLDLNGTKAENLTVTPNTNSCGATWSTGGEGGGGGNQDAIETIRIIAEDLTVNQRSDFDFNDVVFDVMWNTTKNTVSIKLLAAGGELPIYIGNDDNAREIHELFSEANPTRNITVKTMMNTYQGQHNSYSCPEVLLDDNWWSGNTIQEIANSIMLRVQKSGTQFVLKAPKGEAPSKIAVGTDYEWCDERQDIEEKYGSKFTEYVGGAHSWDTWYK